MDLLPSSAAFLAPGRLVARAPAQEVWHVRVPEAKSQSSSSASFALAAAAFGAACARSTARRAYGGGYGGYGGYGSPEDQARRTEMKRARETEQFFAHQRMLLRNGVHQQSEAELARIEKQLFQQAHVTAGINFAKYDNIEVTAEGGTGKEKPIASFQEACEKYNLPDELTENLNRCSYSTPTPVQKYSVPAVLEGSDVMVSAQTGSGKTAAFLVPIITAALKAGPKELKEGAVCPTCVILAPTRELCQQIAQEARRLTFKSPARVSAIYGGESADIQLRSFAGGVEIVVCAPGRLHDFLERGVLSMEEVKFLVVDEADRMLDMGFEPQIRDIIENFGMPEPGEGGRQTMMFSATFPQEMQDMALDFLDPAYYGIKVGQVGHAATDVEQFFEQVSGPDKNDRLVDVLKQVPPEDGGEVARSIVFTNTKGSADDIAWHLNQSGISAEPMHGGLTQNQRTRALRLLKEGKYSVLVATDVAARGLDVPGIQHVINYDLPSDGDSYVHRIGRTGRIGNKGRATSFVTPYETSLTNIVRAMKDAKKDDPEATDVPDWLEEAARSRPTGRGGGGGRRRY
mmetsp:Transcript_38173/g.88261  ORF Transcript_38173/g.88261 Transcript_38173/m.88261 type:complete len:573 (-) Transcript_38173:57-1775(-)